MERLRTALMRLLRSRKATSVILLSALLILVVSLILVVGWIAPRRVQDVVTVDGKHRWSERAAPPRRQITWQPAEQVVVESEEGAPEGNLIRPHLTDGGSTLYFTLRQPDGTADIYRSGWTEGGWGSAEPVTALNSTSDDVGPVISADGSQLFLYSNRPGGQGGFDLYQSRRTENGWSAPQNLGPTLNTPAHEYDPAIAADGTCLLFASNRTSQMHRQAQRLGRRSPTGQEGGEPVGGEQSVPWSATLRAEQGLAQFDLYVARRNATSDRWNAPEPLKGANRNDSNEGAPYLSSNGVFLYFASDRPNEHGESRNYDLYRGRIDVAGRRVHEVANLGNGVNSPANETEPALSPEGFRILFSSDRGSKSVAGDAPPPYNLYSSTAEETRDDVDWDTTRWSLLLGWLSSNGWWLLLLLLLAALIASVVWMIRQWSLRQWSFRKLPVPGFLLVAIALHLLLATGSFFVYFGQEIVDQARKAFEEVLVASNVHQSHEAGQESYEKVADLQSLEAAQPAEVVRQVTESPRVNVPTDSPIPSLPTKVAAESSLPQRAIEDPAPESVRPEEPQLQRRKSAPTEATANERIELEPTRAVESSSEEMTRPEVAVTRQQETKPQPNFEPPETSTPAPKMQADEVPTRPFAEATPAARRRSMQPLRKRVREMVEPADAPEIATEAVEPAEASGPSQVASINVQVDRQTSTASPDSSLELQPSMTTSQPSEQLVADGPSATASLDVPPQLTADPNQDNPLGDSRRGVQLASDASAAPAIETFDLGDAPQPAPSMIATEPTGVQVERQLRQDVPLQSDAMNLAEEEPAQQRIAEYDEPSAADASGLPDPDSTKVAPPLNRLAISVPSEMDLIETQPIESLAAVESEEDGTEKLLSLAQMEMRVMPREATPLSPQTADDSTSARLPAMTAESTETAVVSGQSFTEAPTVKVASQLQRHRAVTDEGAMEESIATKPAGAAQPVDSMAIAGMAIGVTRSDEQLLETSVRTPDRMGGIFERRSRPEVGSIGPTELDAPPAYHLTASRLDRRPARAPLVLYAEDDIGLQSMLRLRGIEMDEKKDLVQAFGGKVEALAAVDQGLTWIQKHQHEDGHWSLHEFDHQCQGHKCDGHGSVAADAAATGFALLPLLGDGHTHQTGKYQKCVEKGLRWLIDHQKENGDLYTESSGNAHMYSHGIAAIALCEAYGMSRDPELREPAQRAVDFIVEAQHEAGGWRYHPKQPGDTSVMGWQIMALKSGQMAELNVPTQTLDKAQSWLRNQAGGKGNQLGTFGYQNASGRPAMTAEALLCLEYLGAERTDPHLIGGVDYMLTQLPKDGQLTSYYWYYGTQVMYHMQGDYWKQWNGALHDVLLKNQVKSGSMAGTWNPRDNWEKSGGRIFATSLRLLMLEVYYRHLPLYQVLQSQ